MNGLLPPAGSMIKPDIRREFLNVSVRQQIGIGLQGIGDQLQGFSIALRPGHSRLRVTGRTQHDGIGLAFDLRAQLIGFLLALLHQQLRLFRLLLRDLLLLDRLGILRREGDVAQLERIEDQTLLGKLLASIDPGSPAAVRCAWRHRLPPLYSATSCCRSHCAWWAARSR